ncbi:TetR family transcriptional regulator [Nocardia amamiensis]|uniref:TetR family transcriptional regulator n=1 Tax=Nocardia amamiensis TaxID=404578 RepID=A0ABS0D057_9NOCA|nr:TetR family transcriptional regulator [Nocardia amamiensis]MBF6301488.1 TetR family transcriptional regulator [Nocardia amamiensis]
MATGVRHLKMAELSSSSGIPASTIRHYLRLGLLPEPLRTAPTMAYYGPEHRERLIHIRRRLEAGATLQEVRRELVGQASPPARPENDQPVHSSQRARLIEAGSAVFLHAGFEAASVEDVVARAGVGKGAFYRHFDGKRDLLAACIASELDWYDVATSGGEPSLERLMSYSELFEHRRLRALISLFALLRQAEASGTTDHGEALPQARARLRAPLEADLRAARERPDAFAGDERLQAEMLLAVAEYTLAYAVKSGSGQVADLVRHGWKIVLAGHIHA